MNGTTLPALLAAGDRLNEVAEQHAWARATSANALAAGDDDEQQRAFAEEREARRDHDRAVAAFVALRDAATAEVVAAYIDIAGEPLL